MSQNPRHPGIESWTPPAQGLEFLKKAQENYFCAKYSFEKNLSNAAASRFYYALYLAARELMDRMEVDPPPVKRTDAGTGEKRWTHPNLRKELADRTRPSNLDEVLRECWLLRGRADYERKPIDRIYYGNLLKKIMVALDDLCRRVQAL